MKVLKNKGEELSNPLCNCNSKWSSGYEELPETEMREGKRLFRITDLGSRDRGKLFIMVGDHKPCPLCGMNKWRILE